MNAQVWVSDSVTIGAGYANRAFYSLENGNVGTPVTFNNIDWLVDVSTGMSASIRINGGFNAALYKYTAGDTTDWATLDTAGIATSTGWTRVYDTEDSFFPSAFEIGATGHPNYGWGNYNSITHDVIGNKLFVYKTVGNGTPGSSVWKKIWIVKLASSNSAFTVKVADLNGANANTISISKQGVTGKSFIYYSFATGQTTNAEPAITDYDLTFSKYMDQYGSAPHQAVTGVEINHGVTVAKADNVLPDAANVNDYTLEETLNGIGHNWKVVDMVNPPFPWLMEDSLSYFVKDVPGNIWQIRFTKFVGSSAGKYVFQKRKLSTASVEENNETVGAWTVFPNPATENVSVVFNANVNTTAQFTLIDLNGRAVMAQTFAAQTGINQYNVNLTTQNLPAGIYVATLRAGDVLKTTKLIIR